MEEVVPGVLHWSALHQHIRQDVHSHYVPGSRALFDPMLPDEALLELLRERGGVERILLSNRHHYRHSGRFVEEFGCPVLCHEAGLHEFSDGPAVEGFSFETEPAPGVTAREVAAICPEDTAFHIAAGDGALLFADGLIRAPDGRLSFVLDAYIGDDPEGVKRGLLASFRALLELDFDTLLFAHGPPLPHGGKTALREFVEGAT